MKKRIWKVLLILGFIPFIIALILGIFVAVNGFGGLNFCCKYYGFQAFFDYVLLFSFIYYPTYIVGILLIILSIIKLRKINKY